MDVVDSLSTRRRVRGYILFTIVVLASIALCWELQKVLKILYVSALFAVVLTPVVKRIQRLHVREKHVGQSFAVLILLFGILIALGLFFWIGLPPVVSDFSSFITELPNRIPHIVDRIHGIPLASKLDVSHIAAQAQNSLGAIAAYIVTSIPLWASHLLDVLTAVILCVYFILEGPEVYAYFVSLIPKDRRARLASTLVVAQERVSRWLFGQLLLMGIVAVYSLTVFGALHVRYFLLLGILMGITNIIPIAGNLITISLAILVAASDSWGKALGVIIAYLVYTQVENAVLTPRIMKSSVDLMGVTVLVALLCGTALAGIVGALVAVPTAAIVVVFANEYLVQKDEQAEQLTEAAAHSTVRT